MLILPTSTWWTITGTSNDMSRINARIVIVICFCCGASSLHADQPGESVKPEWELGAGIGGQLLADYRGSDHYQLRALPFPLVVYRGDFLRADEEGIRGRLFADNRIELNLSADLSLANDDGENSLRRGMLELLPTFEIGPDFAVNLSGEVLREGWALHMSLRGAVATDLRQSDYIGWVFNPNVAYRQERVVGDWNLVGRIGMLYGSDRYHSYFYSVAPQYETATRGFYDAGSGYGGAVFKLGLRRRYGSLWLGGTLRYDYLGGAEFSDSPLIESNHFVSIALGAGWYFWQSGRGK